MFLISVFHKNEFCPITAVSYHSAQPQTIIFGTAAGDLYAVDIRQPSEFISKIHLFDCNVHRIVISPDEKTVSVCGETESPKFLKYNEGNLELIMKETMEHEGFVRGLAWKDDLCYSCGFDGCVVEHKI